jgi:hypothetical protein
METKRNEAENSGLLKKVKHMIYAAGIGATLVAYSVAGTGCATTSSNYRSFDYHQNYAVGGAVVGAGTGAIIGHQSGKAGKGALVGGLVGSLIGSFYNK